MRQDFHIEETAESRRSFSVVVCTRNRARMLPRALDSVLAQEYPKDRYELIVVDNASSDGTRALIEWYLTSASVAVSYHLEPRPGVSFARNLGAERARHEYVAFLDDDAAATPGWLAAFDAAIRQHGALAAGGPVEPVLEPGIEPPAWWDERDLRCLFGLDHANLSPAGPVLAIRWPLWLGGGNSVYSKWLLQDHGGFRTDFGPTGRHRRVAEDIDLNARIERAGVPIFYVRDAWITHTVTADRLHPRYLWRRAYWAGRTDAAVRGLLGDSSNAGSLPHFLRAASRLVLSRKPARTVSGCRLAYHAGYQLQKKLISLRSGMSRLSST